MIAAFLLALAVSADPDPTDIVVIGEQLKAWRGNWSIHKSKVTCTTTRSTGDPAVDEIGCLAITQCVTPIARPLEMTFYALGERSDRQHQFDALLQSRVSCLTAARRQGVAALAGQRAAQ